MRKTIWSLLLLSLLACQNDNNNSGQAVETEFKNIKVQYPNTYRDTSVVEDYFGMKVADPYRWLEDEDSPSTERWAGQQRSLTDNYMSYIPYRDAIRQRLAQLWNYERFSTPQKVGGYYYLFRNDGLQNQDVLYRLRALDSELEEVLNPNDLSKEGTLALSDYSFSKDGSLLAYQLSDSGSDWQMINIKSLDSGAPINDTIRWVKFSGISWYRDGFFYARYPAPREGEALTSVNEFHQVYYHRVGSPQSEDELVFADRLHPDRIASASTTEDERFLILRLSKSTSGNALYFRSLGTNELDFTPIEEGFEHKFEVIGNSDNSLFVLTDHKAPNGRLLRINTRQPGQRYWQEVIPESKNDVLREVYFYGGKLIAHYLHDAYSQLRIFSANGKEEQVIQLPGIGTVTAISGKANDPEAFYEFTTLTEPGAIYRVSLSTLSQAIYKKPRSAFKGEDYETRQVTYKSYDGTEIPMLVVHRKGLRMDGNRPTLLYGYGGFNLPVLPAFNRTRYMLFPAVLENGGVCAIANIRGGGEFGAAWHKAGTKHQKQNVFDDFQAAAEYLIANKYTSPAKLAIHGASNGGLLVGACLTQRPDLYAVALPAVGVLDMLRYHKFTIGWAWAEDYGISDNKEDFDYLIAYSPLHNVVQEQYPATLITTADHDDRVVPAHSFKFAATLQARQQGDDPILIRIEPSAGHGAGSPTTKRIEAGADMLAFLFYNMREPIKYTNETAESN